MNYGYSTNLSPQKAFLSILGFAMSLYLEKTFSTHYTSLINKIKCGNKNNEQNFQGNDLDLSNFLYFSSEEENVFQNNKDNTILHSNNKKIKLKFLSSRFDENHKGSKCKRFSKKRFTSKTPSPQALQLKEIQFRNNLIKEQKVIGSCKFLFNSSKIKKHEKEKEAIYHRIGNKINKEVFDETTISIDSIHYKAPQIIHICNSSLFKLLGLISLISIHSFVEGICIGISEQILFMITIYVPVLMINIIELKAIVNNLNLPQTDSFICFYLLLFFSVITPLGILIGILFQQSYKMIKEGIFVFGSGIFLYIGANEIKSIKCGEIVYCKLKYILYICGIIIIGII